MQHSTLLHRFVTTALLCLTLKCPVVHAGQAVVQELQKVGGFWVGGSKALDAPPPLKGFVG